MNTEKTNAAAVNEIMATLQGRLQCLNNQLFGATTQNGAWVCVDSTFSALVADGNTINNSTLRFGPMERAYLFGEEKARKAAAMWNAMPAVRESDGTLKVRAMPWREAIEGCIDHLTNMVRSIKESRN